MFPLIGWAGHAAFLAPAAAVVIATARSFMPIAVSDVAVPRTA
jgi:hypothetical protein